MVSLRYRAIFSGRASQSNITILNGAQTDGRGFTSVNSTGSPILTASLTSNSFPQVFSFNRNDGAFWGMTLGYVVPVGYWSQMYFQGTIINNAYLLSNADASGASGKPGPGWLTFPEGFFIGLPVNATSYNPPPPVFIGHVFAETDPQMRAGERLKGDQFISGIDGYTLVSNGYRGHPYNIQYTPAIPGPANIFNAAIGLSATIVEPSTNTGTTNGGERVFRCIIAGTTSGTEPIWPTTLNSTIVDGGVTWQLVGFTPAVAHKGENASASNTIIDNLREDGYTTTSSANQLLFDYVVNSPPSGQFISVLCDFEIVGGNGADGYFGSAKVSGTFRVASSGTITRAGSDDNAIKGLNGTTFVIDISASNHIKLEVSPSTAIANYWGVSLIATKRVGITT